MPSQGVVENAVTHIRLVYWCHIQLVICFECVFFEALTGWITDNYHVILLTKIMKNI